MFRVTGAAFVEARLAAVAGFGGPAVRLPVLVAVFGPRLAVPILTVAQLVGNGSRLWFNRDQVDFEVVGWFALGPLMIAGSWAGHRLVDRMPERAFVAVIELTMAGAGAMFLVKG
ncbi:MAG TPA: sulfite exporter TauE/SafE family protein [Gemmatimonadales bacterium]|nr:sulfite exporter TauE/SafE family protein [Gemmatimonadales bacterium]